MNSMIAMIMGFLLIPTLAFSQADFLSVDTFSDAGSTIIITLTPLGKVTYDRVKAEQGDRIAEEKINLWLLDYARHYAKEDAENMNQRLKSLSLADKQKVMDQLNLCEQGSC